MEKLNKIFATLENGNNSEIKQVTATLFSFEFSDHVFNHIQEKFDNLNKDSQDIIFKLFQKWKSPETINFLAQQYSMTQDFTRKYEILKIISTIPLKHNIKRIYNLLKNETSHELKISLINLLGNSNNPNAFKLIMEFSEDEDLDLRSAAMLNALNLNYRDTLTDIYQILESGNDDKVIELLNVLTLIDTKDLKYEISDFFLKHSSSFKKKPVIYMKFINTLFNFRNKKVLDIAKKLIEKDLLLDKLMPILHKIENYEYNAHVQNFFSFIIKTQKDDITKLLYDIILKKVNGSDEAKHYTQFLDEVRGISLNLVVNIIMKNSVINLELDKKLIELLKKETEPDYFGDIFACLISENTSNNTKILVLQSYFSILPEPLKFKVVSKFYKLQRNQYATNIIYYLYSKSDNQKVQSAMVSVLGFTATENDTELFKEILQNENARIRANAIESLDQALRGSEDIVDIIMPFLQDYNNRVKANVEMALWQHGGLRMLNILGNMLLNHEDKWHRASAAYALGAIKNSNSINALIDSLKKETDIDVIRNSVKSLGRIGDPGVSDFLIRYFNTTNDEMKLLIIDSLGHIGNHDSIPFLFNLTQSDYKKIAIATFDALKNFKSIPDKVLEKSLLNALKTGNKLKEIFEVIGKTASISFIDRLKTFQKLNSKHNKLFNRSIKEIKNKVKEQ
ncbi:MAG: hypothetical protein C0601_05230 [Candidatus Muiribacterium halophilum]|uniref:HEAT repeat domain-containing protein n=1 Tax=Muiribacterium halophilum TaxID=2053465 RepID=A0A2N5ZHR8_MUIH1|nr:MAG: hypothetical protein C0601_05230 [Candidatus Muirbacterium halophilum]